MKIYIDKEYHCHTSNPDGVLREIETDFFDGKCATFIEGYRFIPDGECWIDDDGVPLIGEMIAPWKPYNELAVAQVQYEADLEEAATAYQEGVDSV